MTAQEETEFQQLRAEVRRLLAAALRTEDDHRLENAQRDHQHVLAMASSDQLHADEIERLKQSDTDTIQRLEELALRQRQNYQHGLDSRDVIGQAKGIIMASMGCSADQAFELLKKQSQAENRKLIDIATEMAQRVQRRRRETPQP